MAKAMQILPKSLSFLITAYRYLISPLLGQRCRFLPSCSEYAQIAIQQHGVIRGIFLAAKRLSCCHPWHPGGYDPVPSEKITKE